MNWDYTTTAYAKQKKHDKVWALERAINYGLPEENFDRAALEAHWDELNIPEERRDFLALLLWNKRF